MNRRALVTPSVTIKSDTCGAGRRRDPKLKHRPAAARLLRGDGVSQRERGCNSRQAFDPLAGAEHMDGTVAEHAP